jgi:hypothetical protein
MEDAGMEPIFVFHFIEQGHTQMDISTYNQKATPTPLFLFIHGSHSLHAFSPTPAAIIVLTITITLTSSSRAPGRFQYNITD